LNNEWRSKETANS